MNQKELNLNEHLVWASLHDVKDPEIPALSLVELGVVRSVTVDGERVHVALAPTFSGCPALELMRRQVEEKLLGLGFVEANVTIDRSLAWSSDMLNGEARRKLKAFGVTPPPAKGEISLSAALSLPVECPFCGSNETTLESAFGSTLCKQIYYCERCRQSFERFKPL